MLKEVDTYCGRCGKIITQGFEIRWGNNHYVCKECEPLIVTEYEAKATDYREQATFWDKQASYASQKKLVKNL